MPTSDHASSTSDAGSPRLYLLAAQQLMTSITRGDYQPGTRLPSDRELAVQRGISRPTMREAILALELAGVVEIRRGDGTYVSPPGVYLGTNSRPPIDVPPYDLVEARRVIEPAVAAYLASHQTDSSSLDQLYESIDRCEAIAADIANLPEFVRIGLDFHRLLAKTAENQILADVTFQLVDVAGHPLWTLVNQQAMRTSEARAAQIHEHRMILDAIRRGDGTGASQLMKDHIQLLAHSIFGPTPRTG